MYNKMWMNVSPICRQWCPGGITMAWIRPGWTEALVHNLSQLRGQAGEGSPEEQAAKHIKEGQQQGKTGFAGGSLYQPVYMDGTRSTTAIPVCRSMLNLTGL